MKSISRRRVIGVCMGILISTLLFGQDWGNDLVYLKNGNIIKGTILENKPGNTVKIEATDGSILIFNSTEIDSIHSDRIAGPSNDFIYTNHLKNPIKGKIIETKKPYPVKLKIGDGSIISYKRNEIDSIYTGGKKYLSQKGPSIVWIGANIAGGINYSLPYTDPTKDKLLFTGGFSIGFKLYLQPKGIVGFETGLLYTNYGSNITFSDHAIVRANNSDSIIGQVPFTDKTVCRTHILEWPVLLVLHSKGEKIRFCASTGVSVGGAVYSYAKAKVAYSDPNNYFPNNSVIYQSSSGDVSNTYYNGGSGNYIHVVGFDVINFLLQAGIEAIVTKNVMLRIMPAFKIGLYSSPYTDFEVYGNPWTAQINFDLLFNAKQKGLIGYRAL